MITYSVLGTILVKSLLSAPSLSRSIQHYMNILLGPLLIIVGMALIELITPTLPGMGAGQRLQSKVEKLGMAGALVLGLVFALSFCPVSAALFFGSLIPIAVRCQSGVLIPLTYGLATGLPVLVFSLLIAMGAQSVGKAYNRIKPFELWARRITGALFILVGTYYSLLHIW